MYNVSMFTNQINISTLQCLYPGPFAYVYIPVFIQTIIQFHCCFGTNALLLVYILSFMVLSVYELPYFNQLYKTGTFLYSVLWDVCVCAQSCLSHTYTKCYTYIMVSVYQHLHEFVN